MNNHLPFILMAATAALTGCGRNTTQAGNPAPPPASAPVIDSAQPAAAQRTWKQRWEELDLMKEGKALTEQGKALTDQGKELAAQYVAEARAAFEKVDMAAIKKPLGDLLTAIEKGDFALADDLSKKLDEVLKSDVISKSVEFLKIKAVSGVETAVKAVDDYLKSPELTAAKREFFTRFRGVIHAPETKRSIEVVGYAVCFGCEMQYGQGGGILPALIIGALFNERDGLFKEYGIFKEMGNNPMLFAPVRR